MKCHNVVFRLWQGSGFKPQCVASILLSLVYVCLSEHVALLGEMERKDEKVEVGVEKKRRKAERIRGRKKVVKKKR